MCNIRIAIIVCGYKLKNEAKAISHNFFWTVLNIDMSAKLMHNFCMQTIQFAVIDDLRWIFFQLKIFSLNYAENFHRSRESSALEALSIELTISLNCVHFETLKLYEKLISLHSNILLSLLFRFIPRFAF